MLRFPLDITCVIFELLPKSSREVLLSDCAKESSCDHPLVAAVANSLSREEKHQVFVDTCAKDSIKTVQSLIRIAQIKRQNVSGGLAYSAERNEHPLLAACSNEDPSVAECVINVGMGVDNIRGYNNAVLRFACATGRADLVRLFFRRGLTAKDAEDSNGLYAACRGGHNEIVWLLYRHGVSIDHVRANNASGLGEACEKGFTKIVQLMLMWGLDWRDVFGGPFLTAAGYHNNDIIQLFLDMGITADAIRDDYQFLVDLSEVGNLWTIKQVFALGLTINDVRATNYEVVLVPWRHEKPEVFAFFIRMLAPEDIIAIEEVEPGFADCDDVKNILG